MFEVLRSITSDASDTPQLSVNLPDWVGAHFVAESVSKLLSWNRVIRINGLVDSYKVCPRS